MNLLEINKLVDQGYISKIKHPDENLWIFNYTPKTHYERYWTEETMMCRGLILDAKGQIVARPFKKFFNYTETEIPEEPFEVFEKMDGSLGILYWIKDKPFLATKGAFESEQAIKGTSMLESLSISDYFKSQKITPLFEIIYPQNRVVIDYGDSEKLVFLAGVNIESGKDNTTNPSIRGVEVVKKIPVNGDIESLLLLEEKNKEGFVVRFRSGLRVKVKFKEYIELHKRKFGLSEKSVWSVLREGASWEEYVSGMPDEWYNWADQKRDFFISSYQKIEKECTSLINSIDVNWSRKLIADEFLSHQYPGVLFAMLDGYDYASIIWNKLKPKNNILYTS